MQTIRYIFSDGTTSEIEVADEFYTLYAELVQQEKRNHWKETRRHISLENLNENGIDFASPAADLLSVLIQQEDEKQIHTATTNYEFGWIDDYNGEKILFLDEFRSSFKISEIPDYLDGQPIRIRGRHYIRVACYDTVYIVSNLSLKEQYTNIQQSEPKTWAAFCRRITAVYDFDKSKNIPVNKFTGILKKPPTLIEIADDGDMPF